MGIYEFNKLPIEQQYNTTYNEGAFVDTVFEGKNKYALYSVSYFWVEIEYDAQKNKTVNLRSFVTGELLNRYSNVPNSI